jgi:hypothetical protein
LVSFFKGRSRRRREKLANRPLIYCNSVAIVLLLIEISR